MRIKFRKFLEQNGFLPLSNWKSFEMLHVKPPSPEDKKEAYSKIRKNVGRKSGLYVYQKDGRILYVGEGKLFSRIKSHYIESYNETKAKSNNKAWFEFFGQHQGELKVYWRELGDEQTRKVIEQMLSCVLKPEFESFRRKSKN